MINTFKNWKLPFWLGILVFLLHPHIGRSQDHLETKLTVRLENQPLAKVLEQVGEQAGVRFSYNPDVIDVKKSITIQVKDRKMRDLLDDIFQGKVTYKVKRKYIILKKNEASIQGATEVHVSGYVMDRNTEVTLGSASIYDSQSLVSAISNQKGFYHLVLPAGSKQVRLEIRKEGYLGSSIIADSKTNIRLDIRLSPDSIKMIANLPVKPILREDTLRLKVEIPVYEPTQATASIDDRLDLDPIIDRTQEKIKSTYQFVQNEFISAFQTAQQAVHIRNISDTLYRPFQASILPFLGTNHQLSGNIINDYSLNLIAGYSLGVRKFEVGGIFNVVRGDVTGFQLAGVSNLVGGNVSGFQYGSFMNMTLGDFYGFQGSNLINYTGKNFKGAQIAGFANVVVRDLEGYQVSSMYNYAHRVLSGHQIGIVNYADSSATTPFGMFSFVRANGYRRYEVSSDEFNYFNTSFKTGVNAFYNIFTLGFNGLSSKKALGSIGYGVGSSIPMGRGWATSADLTANAVFFKNQPQDEVVAGLFRLSVGVEKRIGNRMAVFAGPSVNLFVGSKSMLFDQENTSPRPIWIGNKPELGDLNKAWVGFVVALRFCNIVQGN